MSIGMEDIDFLELISTINPSTLNVKAPAEEVDLDLLSSWESGSQSSHTSFDSDETDDSHASKRSKKEEKLQKNREAASRCRQKRKQEQMQAKAFMADLENQLERVKNENSALQLENAALRTENRSLKDTLAKLVRENKSSITGVVAFGVVCMFPIFSSASSSSQTSAFTLDMLRRLASVFNLSATARGAAGNVGSSSGSGGRVLLSLEEIMQGAAGMDVGNMLASWRGVLLLGLAVMVAITAISFLLGGAPTAPVSLPFKQQQQKIAVVEVQEQVRCQQGEQPVKVSSLRSTGSVTLDAIRGQMQQWVASVMHYKEILPV